MLFFWYLVGIYKHLCYRLFFHFISIYINHYLKEKSSPLFWLFCQIFSFSISPKTFQTVVLYISTSSAVEIFRLLSTGGQRAPPDLPAAVPAPRGRPQPRHCPAAHCLPLSRCGGPAQPPLPRLTSLPHPNHTHELQRRKPVFGGEGSDGIGGHVLEANQTHTKRSNIVKVCQK